MTVLENSFGEYCITLFFCRILISQFPYVKNLLHINFADFPVNFIKRFVSCFFWCLKLMLLLKFVPYYCLHYIIPRILHIISRKSWCSMQTKSWWWAIPKICTYLISRFYSKRENRENSMLAKYTCFTVAIRCESAEKENVYVNIKLRGTEGGWGQTPQCKYLEWII